MPTTQAWVDWAKTQARAQMGGDIATTNRIAYVEYCGGITRLLRDSPAPAGTSGTWSRVDELGNADHYWFSRHVVFTAACVGYTPMGAVIARRSALLRRALELIRALGRADETDVEGHRAGRARPVGRGRPGRDRRPPSSTDWIADGLGRADAMGRDLLEAGAAGPAVLAAGGVAVLFSILIPLWDVVKEIAWVANRPGVIPGTDLFDSEPSSAPGTQQMGWAYAGISDAINSDFDYCWQTIGAASLADLHADEVSLDALLQTLPTGAAPSAAGWG